MIKFESLNHYNNVFLTSDSHFSHSNITRGVSKWEGGRGTRDFNTVEEMDAALIEGLSIVQEGDVLIHCGDVAFGNKTRIREYVKNCKGDIILSYGNHDHNIIKHKEYRDLFTSANHRHYLQFKGIKFIADHYPLEIWHQSHHGASLAFGHVHGSLNGHGKSQDVGVDVAYKLFGEYRPFTFEEFKGLVNKEIHINSHHNENTN